MWYDLPLTKVNFFIRYDSWTWRVSAFQRQYPSSMNGLGKTEKWSVNYDVWIHDDLRAQDDYCVTERHCGVGGLASDLEGCEWQCWNKVMVTALAEHRISVTYISLTYLNQFSTDKYPSGWQPAWRLPINTMQVSKVHLSQIRWYDDNICRQNSLRSSSTKIHGRERTSLCLLRRPSAANVQSMYGQSRNNWRRQMKEASSSVTVTKWTVSQCYIYRCSWCRRTDIRRHTCTCGCLEYCDTTWR